MCRLYWYTDIDVHVEVEVEVKIDIEVEIICVCAHRHIYPQNTHVVLLFLVVLLSFHQFLMFSCDSFANIPSHFAGTRLIAKLPLCQRSNQNGVGQSIIT